MTGDTDFKCSGCGTLYSYGIALCPRCGRPQLDSVDDYETEPLNERERDRASLQEDLEMEERALELHLDKEPLPHLYGVYWVRAERARAEIERIKAMLA